MLLDELYQDIIIKHYKNPHNFGKLENAQIVERDYNPFCGDELTLYVRVENNRIEEVRFEGKGCSISQASASMMTDIIKGKTLEEAARFSAGFRSMLYGEKKLRDEELGSLVALKGIEQFPVRVKCAALIWIALSRGIEKYKKEQGKPKS